MPEPDDNIEDILGDLRREAGIQDPTNRQAARRPRVEPREFKEREAANRGVPGGGEIRLPAGPRNVPGRVPAQLQPLEAAEEGEAGTHISVRMQLGNGRMFDALGLQQAVSAFAAEKRDIFGNMKVNQIVRDEVGGHVDIEYVADGQAAEESLRGGIIQGGRGTLVINTPDRQGEIVHWEMATEGEMLNPGHDGDVFNVSFACGNLDDNTLNSAIEHAIAEMSGPSLFGTLDRVDTLRENPTTAIVTMQVTQAGRWSPGDLVAQGHSGGDTLAINGQKVTYHLVP